MYFSSNSSTDKKTLIDILGTLFHIDEDHADRVFYALEDSGYIIQERGGLFSFTEAYLNKDNERDVFDTVYNQTP